MITTTTLDRDEGLKSLTSAVDAIRSSIKEYGGDFNEKAAVRFFIKYIFCSVQKQLKGNSSPDCR